jgi:hypothetical protein
MSDFIIVTEMPRNRRCIISKRHIVFVAKSPNGNDTYVKYDAAVNGNPSAGNHVFVSETVEHLEKMLGL